MTNERLGEPPVLPSALPLCPARGLEYYKEGMAASEALSGYYATIEQLEEVGWAVVWQCSAARQPLGGRARGPAGPFAPVSLKGISSRSCTVPRLPLCAIYSGQPSAPPPPTAQIKRTMQLPKLSAPPADFLRSMEAYLEEAPRALPAEGEAPAPAKARRGHGVLAACGTGGQPAAELSREGSRG